MNSDWYIFPIRISYASNGMLVTFPDFPKFWILAHSEEEAIQKAKMLLGQELAALEVSEQGIPKNTPFQQVKVGPNEICTLIEVPVWQYRDNIPSSFIEKKVILPTWMDLSINNEINLSKIVEEGLKKHFGFEMQGRQTINR